ncbi:hypothetical protein BH11MYX1_BH11MYX1_55100 [soil metagenome]
MRRELVILCALASPVFAEVRALVAIDSYVATQPGSTADDEADFALSVHLEYKAEKRAAIFDYVDRESFIDGTPRRELHELNYVDRSLAPWVLTVGRFRVPGGYWLMTDGVGIARRWGELEVGVFGGNRSFTNARVETLLTASPTPLPLVGASITTRGDVQVALSYTLTKDRIALYRGDRAGDAYFKSEQPEQFVDGEVVAAIGAHDFLTGGVNIGSRYLVTYTAAPMRVTDDPALENVWFGSQAVYGLYDHREGPWRLDAILAGLRTKLGQQSDNVALAPLTGSFAEATLRATWLDGRANHLDARYRARVWGDGGSAHRAEVSGEVREGLFELDARAGLDVHRSRATSPGYTSSTSFVGRVGAGLKSPELELLAGVAAVDTIVDELEPLDDGSTRAPYTLEARSYAFVHAFTTREGWFGGIDGEANLRGDGVRVLAQIGFAR